MLKKLLVLGIAFLILLVSGAQGADNLIYIDKENYLLGDVVKITFPSVIDSDITIISLETKDVYKYLGAGGGTIKFSPKHVGEYIVSISDPQKKEVISRRFQVYPTTYHDIHDIEDAEDTSTLNQEENQPYLAVSTDKLEYGVGEEVMIHVDPSIKDMTLSIRSSESTYNFLGDLEEVIRFAPKTKGDYEIIIYEKDEIFFKTGFSVGDVSSTDEAEISSDEGDAVSSIIGNLGYAPISDILSQKKKHVLEAKTRGSIKLEKASFINAATGSDRVPGQVVEEGRYDVYLDIKGKRAGIKKIMLEGVNYFGDFDIGLDEDVAKEAGGKKVVKSFAIDPSRIDFDQGSIELTAYGDELWKCAEWDFAAAECKGTWEKIRDLVPGSDYNIHINPQDPGFAETGIATINSKKPIYLPGEEAHLLMAVIDRYGHLVDGADVTLRITSPEGNESVFTTGQGVYVSGRGIYEAFYEDTQAEGNYLVVVEAEALDVSYMMASEFMVSDEHEFDILRDAPMSIDPWQGAFSSSIRVISRGSSDGFDLVEVLPPEFIVAYADGADIVRTEENIFLTWKGLSNNSKVTYFAEAPLVSPELYSLGKSYLNYDDAAGTDSVFYEARLWYLAADPIWQLNATSCGKNSNSRTLNSFTTSCSSPWNIDVEDGSTQSASAGRNEYCGIQTTYDQSFTNCVDINKVELCIDWWFTGSVKTCYGVTMSTTGTAGTWNTVSTTCPTTNNAIVCYDVTSTATWACNSFSGGNIATRAELRSNTNGASCLFDAVYFRVNYSAYADITGSISNNGPVPEGSQITFTGSCSDLDPSQPFKLVVCDSGAATCDDATSGTDLICEGSLDSDLTPSCSYTTTTSDIGTNSGDKAVCCDSGGNCDPVSITINDWTVTTLSGPPVITINSVSGDSSSPYSTTDSTPVVNAQSNRNGTCYLSELDESYSDMVSNGRVNCGQYVKDVAKDCEYTNPLTIGLGSDNLYMSCSNDAGGENSNTDNADMTVNILCDSHTDCSSDRFCDTNQQCSLDHLSGYNCQNLAYGLGEDDEVCSTGGGTTSRCVNDSSYSYTGWYCTADFDDCVYNNNGNSYDLNYILCVSGTNDYRQCSSSNIWGTLTYCADQNDPYDMGATASSHTGDYCGYYSSSQTCLSGDTDIGSYGCQGLPTDCGSYIYLGSGVCGSTASDCDVGCGAECDADNSTIAGIESGICYYDKSCANTCSWQESSEESPEYCINDGDGGACAYSDRTNPRRADTCYWNPVCADGTGATLSQSGSLREDYCDYCSASGSVIGSYSPAANASCMSGCVDSGTIYYDTGATPLDRSDDCSLGLTTIASDTLSLGDVWDGSNPAFCDNTECDLDCGAYLSGTCELGVCVCADVDDPIISLIFPDDGSWLAYSPVNFTYNVSDLGSGISNCSLILDGIVVNTTYNPTEYVHNTIYRELANGTYNWSIGCYDASSDNRYNETETKTVGVDTTLPSLSNPQISGSIFSINDEVCVEVTASDTFSGIDFVLAEIIPPSPGVPFNITLSDTSSTSCDSLIGDGVYSAELLIQYSGTYNWTWAYAYDMAQNQYALIADLGWEVLSGGLMEVNMSSPAADIRINESGGNNAYSQTCSVSCLSSTDCENIVLYAQYDPGTGYAEITTSTADLVNDADSYSCGNMTENDSVCSHTFTITSGEDSGGNTWPIRCRASSTNSPTTYSSAVNLSINDRPQAAFTYPADDSWLKGTEVLDASLSYDTDGTIIYYLFEIDSTSLFSSPSVICGSASDTCSFDTTAQTQCLEDEKTCYLRLTVTDNDGMQSNTTITIGIDNSGPATILGNPYDFTNISQSSYQTDATASDNGAGVSAVIFEYRQDELSSWASICTDFSSPYSCSWDTSSLAEGDSYQVRAYSNDTLGNVGNTDMHTNITIDKSGPSISLAGPDNETFTGNLSIIFYYEAEDLFSDIMNCSIYVDGILQQTNFSVLEDAVNNFTLSGINEGSRPWYITCTDSLGNMNQSDTYVLNIDRSGPSLSITQPVNYANISGPSYVLSATITDSGAGEDTAVFEYRENSTEPWKPACTDDRITSNIAQCTWDISLLDDRDSYQVRAYSNDTLGNIGNYDTRTNIKIDNDGPMITLYSPGDSESDGDGQVFFLFSVYDDASSVSNCSLMIDGAVNQTLYSLAEGVQQEIQVNFTNGNYYWNITCWDDFDADPRQTTTGTRLLTVDIRYEMGLDITIDKMTYELGNHDSDIIYMSTNTTDYYENPLETYVSTDIIYGNTTTPWWDKSWERRMPVYLNNSGSTNLTNVSIKLNITGLSGYIDSCADEIRIISVSGEEMPVNILSGDDTNYCYVVFSGDITASAVAENNYYVYFNNSAASDPGYGTLIISNITKYDFVNYATAGHTAYHHSSLTSKPPSTGPTVSGETAYTTTMYQAIDSQDANLAATSSSKSYRMHRFQFSIAESRDDILGVYVYWYGYSPSTSSVPFHIYTWNYDSSQWIDGGSHSTTSGSDMVDETYTSTAKEYVSVSQTLTFLAEAESYSTGPGSIFYTNYAYANITYDITERESSIGDIERLVSKNESMTDAFGQVEFTNDVFGYPLGNYSVVSEATKDGYITTYNSTYFELVLDNTGPVVTLNSPYNGTESNSSVIFTYLTDDSLSTITNCSLYIDGQFESEDTTIQENNVQFFYPRLPSAGPHNWSVSCTDFYGNTGSSETWTVIIIPPDLRVTREDIDFNQTRPKEGENVTINATIRNLGGSDALDVVVRFYLGDPALGGTQVAGDFVKNISDRFGTSQNVTLNISWQVTGPGPFDFYVLADPPVETNGSIFELNETNNKAYDTLNVPAWQVYYGNASGVIKLESSGSDSKFLWNVSTGGNIYLVESGTEVDWLALYPLSRDMGGIYQQDDFTEADAALSMQGFIDSINNTFSEGGIPITTKTFTVYLIELNNVPVINSTTTSDFVTGILWDSSDSASDSYDGTQDLVFVTEVNKNKLGSFGTYDYEVAVPAPFDSYKLGSGQVAFYTEIV